MLCEKVKGLLFFSQFLMQSLRNVHISSLTASHIVWICVEALGECVHVCSKKLCVQYVTFEIFFY